MRSLRGRGRRLGWSVRIGGRVAMIETRRELVYAPKTPLPKLDRGLP